MAVAPFAVRNFSVLKICLKLGGESQQTRCRVPGALQVKEAIAVLAFHMHGL
jgi:hypothetical protein